MFNTLNSYEILPNKSLTINLKKVMEKAKLNQKQRLACMLGYFDGDGGFSVSKPTEKYKTVQYSLGITGTYETCKCYEELFEGIGFYTKRHKDNKNNYTYRVSGRNKVKETMGKIYGVKNELKFCFERKYKIFEEC